MRTRSGTLPWLLVLLIAALAGSCSIDGPVTSPQGASDAALRPLDEAHAAEFRQAFEDHKDRARYVVALSPT